MSALEGYQLIKWLHIVSSTLLFGTGIGTAFFFWSARHGSDEAKLFVARTTVRADLLFTLPAVLIQPLTGYWLILTAGHDPAATWLVISYLLYLVAGLCWLPVVLIQIRMRDMLEQKQRGDAFDGAAYETLRQIWFALGWPAFSALLAVFALMIAKPGA